MVGRATGAPLMIWLLLLASSLVVYLVVRASDFQLAGFAAGFGPRTAGCAVSACGYLALPAGLLRECALCR